MEDYLSKIKDLKTKIRDGLFLAPSRSYGEQYIEPFIRKLYDLEEAENGECDAIDKNGNKFEIKSCKVLSKNLTSVKKNHLLKGLLLRITM